MSGTLLRTKLFIPPLRPNLVPRQRLIEKLNQGLHFAHKLTLISASAGFGKTTLASEWIAGCKRPAAWLALDEGDNDPARFLVYLVAALQTIVPDISQDVIAVLQSPQPPPTESILTTLLNEISSFSGSLILVLDDYHVIDSDSIDAALTYLLEHLPAQIHLVIATREDPRLPLTRMRVRGQLTELRANELRFTPAEAAGFLNQAMGLNLSAEEISALENRTEGWIAGLQLAAISMQGRTDTASFIHAFTGSHYFVLDYLVEEVLLRQPEHVRSFLLQTSILDQLYGPLCDAVTGQEYGKTMLEALERSNLFLIPLDDQRQWYRYHHLFADVLQAHLIEEYPHQIASLHRRASRWYEQNGLPSAAIHQALAAKDFERAADLVELAFRAMDSSFQSAAWLSWVRVLPDALIRARPVLSTQYAEALAFHGGELEASERWLRDAEQWLVNKEDRSPQLEGSANEMVVVDQEQFEALPARIAIARAQNALALGDGPMAVHYAELAIELTPEDDQLGPQAAVLLGFTQWASGDLDAAHRSFAGWVDTVLKAGSIHFAVAATFVLADIRVAQGRLHEAVRTYKHALQLASEQDQVIQRILAHQHLGLAMLYHEMGEEKGAAQHLQKSRELGEQSTLADWPHRWCLAQARLEESRGDLEAAFDLLDEAKRLYVRNQVPVTRPVEALKAKLYVRQGRLAEAHAWVHEHKLSVDDELSYLREFEHLTLARVLIAEYESSRAERSILQALGLLQRLLKAAEEGRRAGSVIEILVMQTLAHQAQDNIPAALSSLERTLLLAEPESYVQLFLDEGSPMAQLLLDAAARGIEPDYTGKLLAAFDTAEQKSSGPPLNIISPVHHPLPDPLSRRELEILRLLKTELTGPEIAQELMIALSTVRTHTKSIYSKLDVNNRRTAVKQAEVLKLI